MEFQIQSLPLTLEKRIIGNYKTDQSAEMPQYKLFEQYVFLFYKRINVPAYSVISIYIYLKTLEIWGHVREWFIKWYCLQYRAFRTVKENWKMSRIVLYLLIFPNLHKTVEFYILHKKKFSLQSAKVLYQVSMSSNNERNKVRFFNFIFSQRKIRFFLVPLGWVISNWSIYLFIMLENK